MKDASDIDLVAAAKAAGDDRAFAELVRRHQGRLRAFLHRLGADATLADDIAQDAFVKAHAALASFRGGGSFRSWLCAIAYREFLQTRRKAGAAMRIEASLRAETGETASSDGAQASLSMDLRKALAGLEDRERAALILCDAMGMSHSEAAAALAAPLGSVKTCIARARAKMRKALSSPDEELNDGPQKTSPERKKDGLAHA